MTPQRMAPSAREPVPTSAVASARSAPGRTRTIAAAVIALVAVARTLMMHAPMAWFDFDPLTAPTALAGIGPAWSLLLDALVLLAAAMVLALLPAVPIILHGTRDADSLWRGMQWLSAVVGATAVALALRGDPEDRALRSLLAAIVLGGLGPLLVRAGVQLVVEQPEMMEHFRAHRGELLAAQGWGEGSPQALLYERRLEQWEASAWFGLANVLSSMAAAGAVGFAALAFGARRVLEAGTVLLLAVASAACAGLVCINGSKGAIGAMVIAAVAAWWLTRGRRSGAQRDVQRGATRGASSAAVVLCLLLAVVAAVAMRGVVGEASGERSLLFRWQYLEGAMRVFAQHWGIGVGAAGFGEAYLTQRSARAPEEVLSAHSVWADWLSALGVFGVAWIALLLASAAAIGASLAMAREDAHATSTLGLPAPAPDARTLRMHSTRLAIGVAGSVFVVALLALLPEWETLDARAFAMRLGGAAAGALVAYAAWCAMQAAARWAAIGLGAMAIALLLQAQIEMTLWQPGSSAWILLVIALAAALPAPLQSRALRSSRAPRIVIALCATATAALAMVVFVTGVIPARAAERRLTAAAAPLAALGAQRMDATTPLPPPPDVDERRADAARALVWTDDLASPWARRPVLLGSALEQMAQAVAAQPRGADPALRVARRAEALALAEALFSRVPREQVAGAAALVAEAVLAQPDLTHAERTAAAVALRNFAQAQVQRNPRSVRGWSRLAQAARELEDPAAMRAAAQRALECDESYALDPARRLPEVERAALQAIAR